VSVHLEPVLIRYDDTPPSFNVLGTRGNPHILLREKQRWEQIFIALLTGVPDTLMQVRKPGTTGTTDRSYFDVHVQRWGDLPQPCERVTVEGQCTFPDRRKRDQGNYRVLIEKALGDALQIGPWLADDSWDQYEFGGLQARYERGVRRLELTLFATAADQIEAMAA
jgi:hypothetical protein